MRAALAFAVWAVVTGSAVHGQSVEVIRLGERQRIGSIDDGKYALQPIPALLIAEDGTVYAGQAVDNRFRVYGASGEWIDDFGQRGAGPGEFRTITRAGWRGDTLWVADPAQRRVTFFDRAGQYIRDMRISDGSSMPVLPIAVGTYVIGATTRSFANDSAAVVRIRESRVDTLQLVDRSSTRVSVRLPGGSMISFPEPFSDDELLAASASGAWLVIVSRPEPTTADSAQLAIVWFNSDGQPIGQRRLSYTPVPLRSEALRSVAERQADRARWMPFLRTTPLTRIVAAIEDAIRKPRFEPHAQDLMVHDDGTVWLRIPSTDAQTQAWAIYDRRGQLRGQRLLPRNVELLALHDECAWGWVVDDLDVVYLVEYCPT